MKRLTVLLLACTILLSLLPPAQAVNNSPSLSGIQIFPKDHILNTRVDTLPLDAKSDIYINDLVTDTAPYIGLRHYISTAIPYNVVDSSQPHQYITSFKYLAYSDNVPYPIPDNPLYETGCADHHMEIIDVDEMVLYELGGMEQLPDGTWKAGSGAVWDLESYLFRKNNKTPMWSTDEAGLPVLPGLVRYDEVSSGHIDHSLRISVPALQNTWVWPARTSSPLPGVYDPKHPPAGQRFRLKASFDISGYPPQTKVILQALKTYGATASTMTGVGKPMTVIGSPDSRWNFKTDLNTLSTVKISDFEAVEVSSLMIDPNSAQARTPPGVTSTPAITVTSPNGGESLVPGTTPAITWTSSGSVGSSVKIELLKAGDVSQTVSSSTSNDGTHSWTIPSTVVTGTDYRIRITSATNAAITDTSNSNFAITSATSTPSITVTSPNGGESLVPGTTPAITWTSSGSVGSYVKIELLKAGAVVQTISTYTLNDGSFTSWTIPSTVATGTDYRIRITSATNAAITDTSNSNFAIGSATSTPSITVTSPNGGESLVPGTTPAITWTSSGSVGSYVKIELLKAGAVVQTVSTYTLNDGSFTSWTIPSTVATGTDYRIRITSATNAAITDTSNSNFAIGSGTTTPSITVTSPNGGESYARMMGTGTPRLIQWSYTGNPGSTVKIELLKGGAFYKTLTSSTSIGSAGSGSYSWQISADTDLGTTYMIRVTSTGNSGYNDKSNANFSIN